MITETCSILIYAEVPIKSIPAPYNEFVPILKSASRPHSSTVPLPTLASSNLEALPLVAGMQADRQQGYYSTYEQTLSIKTRLGPHTHY